MQLRYIYITLILEYSYQRCTHCNWCYLEELCYNNASIQSGLLPTQMISFKLNLFSRHPVFNMSHYEVVEVNILAYKQANQVT